MWRAPGDRRRKERQTEGEIEKKGGQETGTRLILIRGDSGKGTGIISGTAANKRCGFEPIAVDVFPIDGVSAFLGRARIVY